MDQGKPFRRTGWGLVRFSIQQTLLSSRTVCYLGTIINHSGHQGKGCRRGWPVSFAGLRSRYAQASEAELRLKLAGLLLGDEQAQKVDGEDRHAK